MWRAPWPSRTPGGPPRPQIRVSVGAERLDNLTGRSTSRPDRGIRLIGHRAVPTARELEAVLLFLALKVVHILSAIVAVGSNVTSVFWLDRAGRDRDRLRPGPGG